MNEQRFRWHRFRGLLALLTLALFDSPYSALAQCEGDSTDSEWLLYINGGTYLNLPETNNWSRYGGKQTTWSKLRLRRDPAVGDTSILVDLRDRTYAVSEESESAWGIAADCRGAPEFGEMSINLAGTPFAYEAYLENAVGFEAFGSVSCDDNQTCSASCGGICGFCGLGLKNKTTAELEVTNECAFNQGVLSWATTTTLTSSSSSSTSSSSRTTSSTTYLGPTTTETSSTSISSTTITTTTLSTTTFSSTSTSISSSTSTTTEVDGFYFYRFSPTQVAQEGSGTACCCAHAVAELYFRNCGADVDLTSAVASNPGGSWQSDSPSNAIDMQSSTKWRDTARQPLVLEWQQLTLVDSYSYLTAADCPDNDPVAFQLHGSQDGVYWELLDSRVMTVAPPATSWRPAQTEWFTFKNCTPTTTVTSVTRTITSRTATSTQTITRTATTTRSTTTSPEGAFVLLLTFGNCLYPILSQTACEEAARQLQLPDTSAETTGQANRPEGCYFFEGDSLWFGVNPASSGKGAETSGPGENETRQPICSSIPHANGRYTNSKASQSGLVLALLVFAWPLLS
eukprot:symbB.v1.2.029727.t1/scaffold3288.1/size59728/3